MRKLTFILLLLPVVMLGQQSGGDFYWSGGFDTISTKIYLIDTLTGTGDTNYEVYNYTDSPDYLDSKNGGYLVLYGVDTIPINTLFSNFNFADTLFFKWENQVLNSDLTENLPSRITNVGHWATPTPDVGNYYNTPFSLTPTMLTVGVSGYDYTSIQDADNASSANDTIIIFDGTYTTQITITDGKTLVFVGSGKISGTSSYMISISSSQDVNILYGEIITTAFYAIQLEGAGSHTVDNCHLEGGILTVTQLGEYTLSDSYVNGRLIINADQNIYRNKILSPSFTISLKNGNTYDIRYNNIESSSTTYLAQGGTFDVNSFNNRYYDQMFNLAALTTENYQWLSRYDLFDKTGANVFINFTTGLGDITLNNCTFSQTVTDAVNDYLYVTDQNTLTVDSCIFTNLQTRVNVLGTSAFNVDFTNNTSNNTTYSVGYQFTGVNVNINGNLIESDVSVYCNVQSTTHDIDIDIQENEFNVKLGASPTMPPVITVGDEVIGTFCDSAIVSGNKLTGPLNYGFDGNGLHAIIFGAIKQGKVSYNNIYGFPLGIVGKSEGLSSEGTVIIGNVLDSVGKGITVRGSEDMKVYNNTMKVYETGINFAVHENVATSYTINADVKNNIVDSYAVCISSDSSQNLTGLSSDNNLFNYVTNNASINSISYNFEAWKSTFTQDLNSFNSDPLFESPTQLWPTGASDAKEGGVNLGAEYKNALDISSTWPDGVVNKTQTVPWDIGAYSVVKRTLLNNGNALMIGNNGVILYFNK